MDHPPLTAHQAQIVRDNPRAGWDQATLDEAQAVLDQHYSGWDNDDDGMGGTRMLGVVLISGAISTVIATVFALWVLV